MPVSQFIWDGSVFTGAKEPAAAEPNTAAVVVVVVAAAAAAAGRPRKRPPARVEDGRPAQAVRAECNKSRRRRIGALSPQCRRPQISEGSDGSEPSRHSSGVRSGYRRASTRRTSAPGTGALALVSRGERSIKQAPGPAGR